MYIYKHPNFFIPKEFQDWLIAAYNWKHNWNKVIDISWNKYHATIKWWFNNWRKDNYYYWYFSWTGNWLLVENTDDRLRIIWDFTWIAIVKAETQVDNDLWCIFNCVWQWESLTTNVCYLLEWTKDNSLLYWHEYWSWSDQMYTTSFTLDVWKTYFITLVRDISKKKYYIYINWILKEGKQYSNNPEIDTSWNLQKLWIWADYWAQSSDYNRYKWYIYYIGIYNKALSQKQIQKMYDFFRQWYYD